MASNYRMTSEMDCGPAACFDVLQRSGVDVTRENVMSRMNFPTTQTLTDLKDNPGAHWRLFRHYGIPWKVVSLEDMLAGNYKKDFTIVLVHALDNPIMVQHYAILHDIVGDNVFMYWGDVCADGVCRPKTFNIDKFKKIYLGGFPNCAYSVGEGTTDWTWEMTYDLVLSFFLYLPCKVL